MEAEVTNQKRPLGKRKVLIISICSVLIVALASSGLFFWRYKADQAENTRKSVFYPNFDTIAGKTMTISSEKGGLISTVDYNKTLISLSIPPGALDKNTEISILPIKKSRGINSDPGVYIHPGNIVFKKPATLHFAFDNSSVKNNDAPKGPDKKLRATGKAEVYRINTLTFKYMPQLIARATETKSSLFSEALGTGIYVYSLDGNNATSYAQNAFTSKKSNLPAILEASTILLAADQKLTADQAKYAKGAVRSVYASANPDPVELYAAIQLNKLLQKKKVAYVEEAHAEVLPGLMEYVCKTTSRDPAELMSIWKAAQALGREDAAESCKKTIEKIISEQIQKLLDTADPTYQDMLQARKQVQALDLGDAYDQALEKKMHDKAVAQANDVLKDEKASPNLVALALQNVFAFAPNETALQEKLTERMQNGLSVNADRVLNDPYASAAEITRAMAQNDATNNPNKEQIHNQLKQKLENRVRDEAITTMGDSGSTAQDFLALAEAADAVGLGDLADLMRKKAADAPTRKPAEVEKPMPPEDQEIPFTDPNEFSQAAKEMEAMGLKTFDEDGLKGLADKINESGQEAANMAGIEGGPMMAALIKGFAQLVHDGVDDFAAEVGEVQARPEDQPVPYDGKNDNTKITGSCIGKEEASKMPKSAANRGYTLCDGVTKDDFGTALASNSNTNTSSPDEDQSAAQDTANSEYDPVEDFFNSGEYNRDKCLRAFPPERLGWDYCGWIESMIQYQKDLEAGVYGTYNPETGTVADPATDNTESDPSGADNSSYDEPSSNNTESAEVEPTNDNITEGQNTEDPAPQDDPLESTESSTE